MQYCVEVRSRHDDTLHWIAVLLIRFYGHHMHAYNHRHQPPPCHLHYASMFCTPCSLHYCFYNCYYDCKQGAPWFGLCSCIYNFYMSCLVPPSYIIHNKPKESIIVCHFEKKNNCNIINSSFHISMQICIQHGLSSSINWQIKWNYISGQCHAWTVVLAR